MQWFGDFRPSLPATCYFKCNPSFFSNLSDHIVCLGLINNRSNIYVDPISHHSIILNQDMLLRHLVHDFATIWRCGETGCRSVGVAQLSGCGLR